MAADAVFPAPHLPETPTEALGEIVREEVFIDDRIFHISRPDESFALLKHPFAQAAFEKDEYMPYWTDLWPAARMMAKVIYRATWPAGLTALEIGCGLGLPGVVALAKGIKVIFSDYDATAVSFAGRNAEINGFADYRTLQMDWRFPPPDLKVPLVIAADLIYEQRNVSPVVQLIKKVLEPEGNALAGGPGPYLGSHPNRCAHRRKTGVQDRGSACRRTWRQARQGDAIPHSACRSSILI